MSEKRLFQKSLVICKPISYWELFDLCFLNSETSLTDSFYLISFFLFCYSLFIFLHFFSFLQRLLNFDFWPPVALSPLTFNLLFLRILMLCLVMFSMFSYYFSDILVDDTIKEIMVCIFHHLQFSQKQFFILCFQLFFYARMALKVFLNLFVSVSLTSICKLCKHFNCKMNFCSQTLLSSLIFLIQISIKERKLPSNTTMAFAVGIFLFCLSILFCCCSGTRPKPVSATKKKQ